MLSRRSLLQTAGAGAAVWAKAELISSMEAKAVATAREERVVMGHLGFKRVATSRFDAEPWMNESGESAFSRPRYFGPRD